MDSMGSNGLNGFPNGFDTCQSQVLQCNLSLASRIASVHVYQHCGLCPVPCNTKGPVAEGGSGGTEGEEGGGG